VLLIPETGRKRLPHVVRHLAKGGNAPFALALETRAYRFDFEQERLLSAALAVLGVEF
jgi:hypothetical protein